MYVQSLKKEKALKIEWNMRNENDDNQANAKYSNLIVLHKNIKGMRICELLTWLREFCFLSLYMN